MDKIHEIFFIYVFFSLSDRQTDEIFKEQMLIDEENLHRKSQTSVLIIDEKIMFLYFYICSIFSLTIRPTDKLFTEQMLIDEENLHRKKQDLYFNNQLRKSCFLLHLTDGQTLVVIETHHYLKVRYKLYTSFQNYLYQQY